MLSARARRAALSDRPTAPGTRRDNYRPATRPLRARHMPPSSVVCDVLLAYLLTSSTALPLATCAGLNKATVRRLLRAGVVPNMSHCQITGSTRFARQVGIIKPNPNLQLTLTLTEEINKHLRTRLCEIAHAQWRGCELFGTASYLILHRHLLHEVV